MCVERNRNLGVYLLLFVIQTTNILIFFILILFPLNRLVHQVLFYFLLEVHLEMHKKLTGEAE